MKLETFRLMTQNLPGDTEIIINYDDTILEETVEFADDSLNECLFDFEDEHGDTVQAIKLVTCYSRFAEE